MKLDALLLRTGYIKYYWTHSNKLRLKDYNIAKQKKYFKVIYTSNWLFITTPYKTSKMKVVGR